MNERYPMGPFQLPEPVTQRHYSEWLKSLRQTPLKLRQAVAGLSAEQLDTPYRDGGWTIRQLVHHIADSHMNSYIRFRWTLTEDKPTIKAYDQNLWAELPDSQADIAPSLALLEALHQRWLLLIERLSAEDWQRSFIHPESGKAVTLERNLALYAWHGEHHIAHILALRERQGWS